MRRRSLLFALALGPFAVHAANAASIPYRNRHFGIDLPIGFIGPVEHLSGASVSQGFRKPYPGTPLNTVILVTVQEMGPSFAKRVPRERGALTRETLEPVVASIEKHRLDFRKSQPLAVTLSGQGGLKVTWSGSAQGIAFDGIVYCVLDGSRAYAIQIQDPSGRGRARLADAATAVEHMRIVQ